MLAISVNGNNGHVLAMGFWQHNVYEMIAEVLSAFHDLANMYSSQLKSNA